MTNSGAKVSLESVSKSFAGKPVLEDLDLEIGGGELLAILGPSGCGKTTALRVIAGFESPDTGRVIVDGVDVTAQRPSKRGIGLVFQAYSLFPHMSAIQNVAYGLKVRRHSRAEQIRRATELLEMVGLIEHSTKFPYQLSGGQQQRVALARAIAIEPRVLLLDEPLSALDAKVRVQLREEIRRIQSVLGTTTVIVTHDQEEALTMADRVAVMRAGKVEQIGTPNDVYERPATPFVSHFVGVSNRLPARMESNGDVHVLGRVVRSSQATGFSGEVVALVRPEDLALRSDAEGTGIVETTTLRGPITSLSVSVAGADAAIRVDLPTSSAMHFRPKDRVDVTLQADSVLVDASSVPTTVTR